MEKKYYPNKIKCKFCNTIIESKFTHDFQECPCGKVFIDGGLSYSRMGFPGDMNPEDCFEYVEISKEGLEELNNMWACKQCGFSNMERHAVCEKCGEERNASDLSIVIQRIDERAKLPEYATPRDAGMDVFACLYDGNPEDGGAKPVDEVLIFPGHTKLVCLGFRVGLPEGWFLDVRPRSGISLNTPLRIANAPGTIDTDYKGIMFALVHNSSPFNDGLFRDSLFRCNEKHNMPGIYSIRTGDKICQLIPQRRYKAEIVEGNVYSIGGNRGGGIGHTDV